VRPVPEVAFTLDNGVGCVPVSVNFSNETLGEDQFYTWDFGDGNTAVERDPSHTYEQAGSYTVRLTVIDALGCDDEQTFSPIIVTPSPTADFSFVADRECELPVELQFTNRSIDAVGYQWKFEEGTFDTRVNPVFSYRRPGEKTIQLIATNTFQCQDTIEKNFLALQDPIADFDWDPGQGCRPLTVAFREASSDATDFFWDFGDGSQGTGPQVEHTYSDPGEYSVTLVADNRGLCRDSLILPDLISVFPGPAADFSFQLLDDAPSNTFQFQNLSNGATSYRWDFGDGATSEEVNPVHQFLSNGEQIITLEAISDVECRDTVSQALTPNFIGTLYIPNVFTPEGSGAEDVRLFRPKGYGLSSYKIEVFNRNGERLWVSTALVDGQPAEAWDGRVDDQLVDQGVYSWRASATFEDGSAWAGMENSRGKLKRQGSLTVIR
jgi:PKD repeat protein